MGRGGVATGGSRGRNTRKRWHAHKNNSITHSLGVRMTGEFNPRALKRMSAERLDDLRKLGELGQLILGIAMGYSIDEIANMRDWDGATRDRLTIEFQQLATRQDE